jgi:site-specific DNA-methyltransferase (adenine-specific)
MLADTHISKIIDYSNALDCFPSADIAGGVCYFLWDKNHNGECLVANIHNNCRSESKRWLNEFSILVKYATGVEIIRKVHRVETNMMNTSVSSRKPFGLGTNYGTKKKGQIRVKTNSGFGFVELAEITAGSKLIDKWKVITSKVSYDHASSPDKSGQRRVLSILEILPPGTICTETYIIIGSYSSEFEAQNMLSYMKTKFARLLISLSCFSQDITKDRFLFVPIIPVDKSWTDEELYKKYSLTEGEITFIQSMIKPM